MRTADWIRLILAGKPDLRSCCDTLGLKVRAAYPTTGFFDPSPTCRIAGIAFRQSQDGMKMIVEQNHCINLKRPLLAAFANGSAQENAGGIGTKNRGAPFRYHSEEEGTAGNISAPKVGHKRNTEM